MKHLIRFFFANFLQIEASFVNEDVEGAELWFNGKQKWMDGDWKIGQVGPKAA